MNVNLSLTKAQKCAERQAKTLESNRRQVPVVDVDRLAGKARVACCKINVLLVNQKKKVYDGQATAKSSQFDFISSR